MSNQTDTYPLTQPCPCGSNKPLQQCCLVFIEGRDIAQSAEQLMRSRYTAYALGNANYIAQTYAKAQQRNNSEADIQAWIEQTHWLGLTIEDTNYSDNEQHFVQFVASYLYQDQIRQLQENSRFIKEDGHWRYIDGNILSDHLIRRVTRNDPCPCNSGKKFKRCHG
ncbi:YchJ family protein [Thalassotalea ponticola]|uniref:YchJ family protein n=1 Tax=Thalassotalea ponticola TaxID=1523392 RepID=UPI0025B40B33|nr:YchJ family protein [Thalassotalea ponticola]MDN3651242.1 YchJ family protein [Thalassotalea ponticola]